MAKVDKVSPWEFVNAINGDKEDLFKTRGYLASDYNAYIINRAFSYFDDTVLIANAANMLLSRVTPRTHFDFYRYAVEPKRRFARWSKELTPNYIKDIMWELGYSKSKVLQVLDLFTKEDIEEVTRDREYGGAGKAVRLKNVPKFEPTNNSETNVRKGESLNEIF